MTFFINVRFLAALTIIVAVNGVNTQKQGGPSTALVFLDSPLFYSFCRVPPQPENGRLKLHRKFCHSRQSCDVPQGAMLKPGSQLVYTCADHHRVVGNTKVYCTARGKWSAIPTCVATLCDSLSTTSRSASCILSGRENNCSSQVPPNTLAKVKCNKNFKPNTNSWGNDEQFVMCNSDARWEPEPITCSPGCGMANNSEPTKILMNGTVAEVGTYPWHANVFRKSSSVAAGFDFQCSGTIIHTNFVLTVAHCLTDETTGGIALPDDLLITAGSAIHLEHAQNDPGLMHKVRRVYTYCEADSIARGYFADIALVELSDGFRFSSEFLPACLDDFIDQGWSFRPGVTGKINGFGRTTGSTPRHVLQAVEVTSVSNVECGTLHESVFNEDDFCGLYSNEAPVCDWLSGAGFFVKRDDLWYLSGLFSVDLAPVLDDNGMTCIKHSHALYSKVSLYAGWIEDVLFHWKESTAYPPCSDSDSSKTTTAMPIPMARSDSTLSQVTVSPPTSTMSTPNHGRPIDDEDDDEDSVNEGYTTIVPQ